MKTIHLLAAFVVLVLAGCSEKRATTDELFNQKASLPAGLPFNPLQWAVISVAIDKHEGTMSTLYGNDLAVTHARSTQAHAYPPGSVLSLVTWFQQDDKHWFGAEIPAQIKSIEFVQVESTPDGKSSLVYQDYEGTPLAPLPKEDDAMRRTRLAYILNEEASVMPD